MTGGPRGRVAFSYYHAFSLGQCDPIIMELRGSIFDNQITWCDFNVGDLNVKLPVKLHKTRWVFWQLEYQSRVLHTFDLSHSSFKHNLLKL